MTTWEAVEPLTDTPEQREYFQSFKVGDRVRVRLSGECQAPWGELPWRNKLGAIGRDGHLVGENHRSGTVRTCPTRDCPLCQGALGHNVAIAYDESFFEEGCEWPGGHYAPAELEPLS